VLALLHGPLKASSDTLADHAALKLSKRARDLKRQFAGRRGGVDRLLVEVQVNAAGLQRLDCAQEVDQRAPNPVDRPGHDNVEGSALRVLEQPIADIRPIYRGSLGDQMAKGNSRSKSVQLRPPASFVAALTSRL
jgi:hypothetical protein